MSLAYNNFLHTFWFNSSKEVECFPNGICLKNGSFLGQNFKQEIQKHGMETSKLWFPFLPQLRRESREAVVEATR